MTSHDPARGTLERLAATAMDAIRREDWGRAEAALRRLVRLPAAPVEAPYNLALVLIRLDKPEQAGHWLRRAVAARPGYAAAWFELGRWQLARWELGGGDLAAARDAFARAAAADPADTDAWRNLARVAERLGDYAQAGDAWRRVEAAAPDAEARIGRMLALLELRDPAGEALRAALWADPALRPQVLRALARSSAGRLPIS